MADLGDPIVLKLLWSRTKDLADVQALVATPGPLDADYVASTLRAIIPDELPYSGDSTARIAAARGLWLWTRDSPRDDAAREALQSVLAASREGPILDAAARGLVAHANDHAYGAFLDVLERHADPATRQAVVGHAARVFTEAFVSDLAFGIEDDGSITPRVVRVAEERRVRLRAVLERITATDADADIRKAARSILADAPPAPVEPAASGK